jgi:SPP1 gp7 family putative phage head morphogenesis protein
VTLQSLAQQHKAALIRRDVALADQLAAQYQLAWNRIQARLSWLFAQMQQAQDSGQDANVAWLKESQRLAGMLDEINTQIGSFAHTANAQVQAQTHLAQHFGAQDATLLLHHALGSVKGVFNQPQPQAGAALSQSLDTGPIARRFAKLTPDAVARAKATLLAAFRLGWGPRQTAGKLRHDLGIQLNDALRISRTESMRSYRTGTLSIYRANSDVVTGWTWLASAGACPFCESMNGQHFSLETPLDSHPNCRCTMTPDVKSYEEILQSVA